MKKLIAFLTISTLFLFSCGDDVASTTVKTAKNGATPKSTYLAQGKVGQIRVICEDNLYTPSLEKALDTAFGEYFEPFYPPQKKFILNQINQSEFERSNRRFRNLIFLTIDSLVTKGKPTIKVNDSEYAATQLSTYVRAHDLTDLKFACKTMLFDVAKQYDVNAWKREYKRNKASANKQVAKKINDKFGISLTLPKNTGIVSSRGNFVRLALPDESRPIDMKGGSYQMTQTNFVQYGVMIWQYDFKDSTLLAYDKMLTTRDTVLKYNAPHEIDGVYMGTQYHPAVLPLKKRIKVNNVEGYELSGLFKFTGDEEPSGGLFWSFTFVNPKTQKVITLSSYVDGPPTMSLVPFIRRVQAILYSVKFD